MSSCPRAGSAAPAEPPVAPDLKVLSLRWVSIRVQRPAGMKAIPMSIMGREFGTVVEPRRSFSLQHTEGPVIVRTQSLQGRGCEELVAQRPQRRARSGAQPAAQYGGEGSSKPNSIHRQPLLWPR